MSYGVLVKNSAGFVQIDQDYKNAVLLAAGSAYYTAPVTVPASGIWGPPVTINFPTSLSPYKPLIFLRYFGGYQTYIVPQAITQSSFSVSLENWYDNPPGSGDFTWKYISGSFDYKVFGYKSSLLIDTYGLAIRNSTSVPVFSSAEIYTRVKAVIDTTIPRVINSNGLAKKQISYTAGGVNDFIYANLGSTGFNGQMGDSTSWRQMYRNVSPGMIEVAEPIPLNFSGASGATMVINP